MHEYRAHGRVEWDAERDFVETQESALRVLDAVVVVHGEHEAACEGVPVDECDCWHGISSQRLLLACTLLINEFSSSKRRHTSTAV